MARNHMGRVQDIQKLEAAGLLTFTESVREPAGETTMRRVYVLTPRGGTEQRISHHDIDGWLTGFEAAIIAAATAPVTAKPVKATKGKAGAGRPEFSHDGVAAGVAP